MKWNDYLELEEMLDRNKLRYEENYIFAGANLPTNPDKVDQVAFQYI